MADLAPVYAALQKADAAGDTAGAKQLADYIRSQPAAAPARSYDALADGSLARTGSPAALAAQSPAAVPASENLAAGIGHAGYNLARGVGQNVGLVNRQDVAQARQQDAPLMATTAGKVGDFIGNAAIAVPTMAIPGANSIVGAGLVGAGFGLAQPSTSTGETLRNIGLGGAVSAAGQAIAKPIANAVTSRLAARSTQAATDAGVNSERDAVLTAGQKAGYVVPPTATNPNVTNTALESLSGKAATRQGAMAKNQPVTNKLVRQDLSIPAAAPLSRPTIENVIIREGQIYGQVKQALGTFASDAPYTQGAPGNITKVSNDLESAYPGYGATTNEKVVALAKSLDVKMHSGDTIIDLFKDLNEKAKANFQSAHGPNGPDGDALTLGRAQSAAADEVGGLIHRQLQSTGNADLAAQWQNARVTIAKAYQALGALKGNDVSATALAAQYRRGKAMSGGMDLAAQFANHFGEAMGVPKSGVGVSKLGAVVAATTGAGAAYLHSPLMAAGAATAAGAPYAARGAMLTRPVNALLASPSYAPSALGTLGLNTTNALARYGYPLSLASVQAAEQ